MTRRKIFLGIAILLLLILGTLWSTGNLIIPSLMEIYGCQEMFSHYYLEPGIAREFVPEKWDLKIHDNGQALVLVMVQECDKMVLDKIIPLKDLGMSHIWIELDGPEEFLEPYPETRESLPTRYWFILPHQLDSKAAHLLFGIAGVDSQRVLEISLGGDSAERSGFVDESASSESNYSWIETSQLYPQPEIVTGSQKFYRQYKNRESSANAKCISHFLGESEVELYAGQESAIGQLGFGTTLQGFANPVWVEYCRVDYLVRFNQQNK